MQPSMGCCEAIKSVLGNNYSNFSGRARRSEFWFFTLFFFIIFIIYIFLSASTNGSSY